MNTVVGLMANKRQSRHYFLLIIVIASALRLAALQQKCLYQDEGWTLSVAKQSCGDILNCCQKSNDVPLHLLLTKSFLYFGNSDFLLRLPAAIAGILSVIIIYCLGKSLFNEKVGCLSAFLAAISPLLILYSRFARQYSLTPLLASLSVFLIWKWLNKQKTSCLTGYVFACIIGIYTHLSFWLLIIAENVFFLLKWKEYRPIAKKWIFAQIAIFVFFIPWLPYFVRQFITNHGTRGYYLSDFSFFIRFGYIILNFCLGESVNPWFFAVTIPTGVIFLIPFVMAVVRKNEKYDRTLLLLFLLILTLLMSLVLEPMTAKHLILVLPFFIILIANGTMKFENPIIRIFIIIGITILSAISLYNYYSNQQLRNPEMALPWRKISSEIIRREHPSDIIVLNGYNLYAYNAMFSRYYQGKLKIIVLSSGGRKLLAEEQVTQILGELFEKYKRVWFLLHYTAQPSITSQDYLEYPGGARRKDVKNYLKKNQHKKIYEQVYLTNEHVIQGWKEGNIHKYKYNVVELHLYERGKQGNRVSDDVDVGAFASQ